MSLPSLLSKAPFMHYKKCSIIAIKFLRHKWRMKFTLNDLRHSLNSFISIQIIGPNNISLLFFKNLIIESFFSKNFFTDNSNNIYQIRQMKLELTFNPMWHLPAFYLRLQKKLYFLYFWNIRFPYEYPVCF